MVGTLTFQKEKIQDIYDEMVPIFIEHYKEISMFKDIKLEPNINEYYKMEDSGMCKTFTAREDGILIGYAVYFIKHNIHYKSSLQAFEDIIYIKKENRGFGKEFILWCDNELKKLGVQLVRHHVKLSHDWSNMLERIGYVKEDFILVRRLDK